MLVRATKLDAEQCAIKYLVAVLDFILHLSRMNFSERNSKQCIVYERTGLAVKSDRTEWMKERMCFITQPLGAAVHTQYKSTALPACCGNKRSFKVFLFHLHISNRCHVQTSQEKERRVWCSPRVLLTSIQGFTLHSEELLHASRSRDGRWESKHMSWQPTPLWKCALIA